MNRQTLIVFALVMGFCISSAGAQDARQIVEEVQKRSRANSQRYIGLLQVIDSKSKITEKKWIYDRIGSYGNSKSIINFTSPAPIARTRYSTR